MEIISSVSGNVSIFTMIGQLWRKEDLVALESAVDEALSVKRPLIVLDTNRLSFINSQGLGLLVRCHVKVKEQGAQLIILNPNEAISDVIELSGFGMFMTIVFSKEELGKTIASYTQE